MTNNKFNLLHTYFCSSLLISCIPSAHAEDLKSYLEFMVKLPDSTISYGTALPVIATDTKNHFLLIGNFESLLEERRAKNSKVLNPAFINNKTAMEATKAAPQMFGAVSYISDGKSKSMQIDSFAYDKRLDISILNVIPDESVFVTPKIASSDSKASLDCSKTKNRVYFKNRKNPWEKKVELIFSISSIRKDVILGTIAAPQTEGKLDGVLVENPYECVITNRDGDLMGINRAVSVTNYANNSEQNVRLIYQPLDLIIPFANQLAATGKISRAKADIGSAVYTPLIDGKNGLYVFTPSKDLSLQPLDQILKANGRTISQSQDFATLINQLHPNDKVTLTILRGKKTQDVEITLTEEEKPLFGETWGFRPLPEPSVNKDPT